jgi:hypothetical protein
MSRVPELPTVRPRITCPVVTFCERLTVAVESDALPTQAMSFTVGTNPPIHVDVEFQSPDCTTKRSAAGAGEVPTVSVRRVKTRRKPVRGRVEGSMLDGPISVASDESIVPETRRFVQSARQSRPDNFRHPAIAIRRIIDATDLGVWFAFDQNVSRGKTLVNALS